MDLKIAFFGTPRFAQIVLEKLIDSPLKPELVITSPDAKVGRGQKIAQSPVKQTAEKNGIEVLQPEKLSEIKDQLANCNLAILVAYGKIIPNEILKLPKYGFINVHPSLLPKYRGPSPIQSAIMSGEEKSGVTIMLLDQEVDHGPIIASKKITISPEDTHQTLIEYLGEIGANLLVQTLPDYLDSKIKPKAQDHKQATFTKHIEKQDGYIDLNNPPDPQTLDRMTRAYFPWPAVWTHQTVNDRQSTIKLLPENLIQPEGKKPMTIKEFLNGYPQTGELIKKLFRQQ